MADVGRSSPVEDVFLPPVAIVAEGVWEITKVVELATLLPCHGYESQKVSIPA
jgi:hypothetical protein